MTTSFAPATAPILTAAQEALVVFMGKIWAKKLPQYKRANKPYYLLSITMEGMPSYVLATTRQQHTILRIARLMARIMPEGARLSAKRMSEEDGHYRRRSEKIDLS